MYSNARLSKPSTTHRRHPRPATSSRDDFQVGTLRPSYSTFAPNSPLPRHQLASQRLAHSSMKAASLPHTPEIFQLNPALVPFSSLHPSRQHAPPSSATPYTPSPHEPRHLPQAGTVLELSKHKPVAEHVGASHHQYPATVVGETLLRQQAILTINSLPTLISRLKEDLADMANSRIRQTPPKRDDEDDQQSQGFFDATQEEDDLPLPALKQKMAASLKPKATYSAAAAGKQK